MSFPNCGSPGPVRVSSFDSSWWVKSGALGDVRGSGWCPGLWVMSGALGESKRLAIATVTTQQWRFFAVRSRDSLGKTCGSATDQLEKLLPNKNQKLEKLEKLPSIFSLTLLLWETKFYSVPTTDSRFAPCSRRPRPDTSVCLSGLRTHSRPDEAHHSRHRRRPPLENNARAGSDGQSRHGPDARPSPRTAPGRLHDRLRLVGPDQGLENYQGHCCE